MALTFGHVHADPLTSQSAAAAAATAAGAAATSEGRVPDLPAPPPDPYRDPAAHDFCAVCANIGVLGALILPASSALVTPQRLGRVRFALAPATVRLIRPRSFNPARGPPSV